MTSDDEAEALPASFFVPREDDIYAATIATRGPWSHLHQHGGPPAALLARSIERFIGNDARVARLSVTFNKPLTIDSYRVKVEIERDGKKVRHVRAHLFTLGDDTRPISSAWAMVIRRAATTTAAGPSMSILPHDMPRPESCAPYMFPFFSAAIGYQTAMEARLMHGRFGEGHMGVWMRMRVPLVLGEEPSPFQRVICAADSGNGVSVGLDMRTCTFVNPDVTVVLARPPVGESIGLDARSSFTAADGIGLADTRLLDADGVVGRGVQTLILESR